MTPEFIVIHHSACDDTPSMDWSGIRRYHKDVKGWKDIGYHFGIERVGDTYEILMGRMPTMQGAHCLGLNTNSIGICCVGNFELAPPDEDQLMLCVRLCQSLISIFNISRDNIGGHREYYKTLCPGKYFPLSRLRGLLSSSVSYET